MMLRLLAISAVTAYLCTGGAFAQNAFRCDQDGKTVYSDKPCPAAKVVAPTQDSAEQKAAAKDANAQMRKDNGDINKRLSEREKLEAQERAAARKANAANAGPAAKDEKQAKGKKSSAGKAKSSKGKATKKSADKKSKKTDNKVSSS